MGVLEGTDYELKACTALYCYAKTMDGAPYLKLRDVAAAVPGASGAVSLRLSGK